jgi:hypothetical protein
LTKYILVVFGGFSSNILSPKKASGGMGVKAILVVEEWESDSVSHGRWKGLLIENIVHDLVQVTFLVGMAVWTG